MEMRVGSYGAAVNLMLLIIGLGSGFLRKNGPEPGLLIVFSLFLVLSAFLVYYFVVARYVGKRAGRAASVLTDSLVGMLSELMIATLAAVLMGFSASVSVLFSGGAAFLNALGHTILLFLLWIYGTHLISILVAGNIAGLIGWYLLEKAGVRLPAADE